MVGKPAHNHDSIVHAIGNLEGTVTSGLTTLKAAIDEIRTEHRESRACILKEVRRIDNEQRKTAAAIVANTTKFSIMGPVILVIFSAIIGAIATLWASSAKAQSATHVTTSEIREPCASGVSGRTNREDHP